MSPTARFACLLSLLALSCGGGSPPIRKFPPPCGARAGCAPPATRRSDSNASSSAQERLPIAQAAVSPVTPPRVPAPTGLLAYADETGALVLLELASGARKTHPVSDGSAGGFAFSPDGRELSFLVRSPRSVDTRVMVLDVASFTAREVAHEHAHTTDIVSWGAGFFVYRNYIMRGKHGLDSRNEFFVVAQGAHKPRTLTIRAAGWPRIAPFASRWVFSQCTSFVDSVACPRRLVAQSIADDSQQTLMETEADVELYEQSPDGRYVFALVGHRSKHKLMRYSLDGGTPLDLGPASAPAHAEPGRGTQISPDGSQVLVYRGHDASNDGSAELLALRTDGSGGRVVSTGATGMAKFTAAGSILYTQQKNLWPGSDTPKLEDQTWLDDGTRRVLLHDFANCMIPVLSGSGALAVLPCEDGMHVYELEGGAELGSLPTMWWPDWPNVLGFDGHDTGLVIAVGSDSALATGSHVIKYFGVDGSERTLGVAVTGATPDHGANWPSFAYWDGVVR